MTPGPETPLIAAFMKYLGPALVVAAGLWAILETTTVGQRVRQFRVRIWRWRR